MIDPAIKEECRETVTVRSLSSTDAYGRDTHSVGTSYQARVVERSQAIYNSRGEVERADHLIWILPDSDGNLPSIEPGKTVLTLADGSEPRILAVDKFDQSSDQDDLNHIKVWLGALTGRT